MRFSRDFRPVLMVKYRMTVDFRRPEGPGREIGVIAPRRPRRQTGAAGLGIKALPKISMQMKVVFLGSAILVFGTAGQIALYLPLTVIDSAVWNTRVIRPRCQGKRRGETRW